MVGQCHKQSRVTPVNNYWIIVVHGCPKERKKKKYMSYRGLMREASAARGPVMPTGLYEKFLFFASSITQAGRK